MKKAGRAVTKQVVVVQAKKKESLDLYDFYSVLQNQSFQKIIEKEKNVQKVFSDTITRINSDCERKLRVCAITESKMYIMFPESSKGVLKLKYTTSLEMIQKLTICKRNSTLMKISILNQ